MFLRSARGDTTRLLYYFLWNNCETHFHCDAAVVESIIVFQHWIRPCTIYPIPAKVLGGSDSCLYEMGGLVREMGGSVWEMGGSVWEMGGSVWEMGGSGRKMGG
jgi:hypothetical protein